MKIIKRWQLKYIGITEDEIIQNGKMWMRQEKFKPKWGPVVVHKRRRIGLVLPATGKWPKLVHPRKRKVICGSKVKHLPIKI